MQRQSKSDLPLTLQNSHLYTLPSKERKMSFVFLDTAGMQRMGETCEGLKGKGDSRATSEGRRAALREVF